MIKSISAREMFKKYPHMKKQLWGGSFASTVGKYGNENMIGNYVKNQGQEYGVLYSNHQLELL